LDVQRGDDVDSGCEEFLDVLVALGVFAAGDVGVGELVDDGDLGFAGEAASQVELLDCDAAVFRFSGGGELRGFDEGGGFGAAVGFD